MNGLYYNIEIGVIIGTLSGYILIGLIRHWNRSDKFILIDKLGVECWSGYILYGLFLTLLSVFGIILSYELYENDGLIHSLVGVVIALAIIHLPRFILDISRDLRYSSKTGELARIKEFEDKLKDR